MSDFEKELEQMTQRWAMSQKYNCHQLKKQKAIVAEFKRLEAESQTNTRGVRKAFWPVQQNKWYANPLSFSRANLYR